MYILIISNPIITCILLTIYGRYIGKEGSKKLCKTSIMINMILTIILYYECIYKGKRIITTLFNWINIGDLKTSINIEYNILNISMSLLINFIGYIVLNYSTDYMKEEEGLIRFNNLILLFINGMLILVLINDLIILFIGWELIGFTSYLLINYWFTSIYNNKCSLIAIFYNKIGDLTLILSISLINNNHFFNFYLLFLLISALTKSAQSIAINWLSLAMAGPTPVSSLLHSATMVMSGVYLLILNKESLIQNDYIINLIYLIGSTTILYSGFKSILDFDLKRIIAYSTASQIGYLFISSIFNQNSSLFHLLSHAHFKALLFMLSGIIIHYYWNLQDIRKIKSLVYFNPLLNLFFFISISSLIGLPYLNGYYSKESIIEICFNTNLYIYLLSLIGIILTTYYNLRLFFILNQPYKNTLSVYSNSIFFIILALFLTSIFFSYSTSNIYLSISDTEFLSLFIRNIPLFLIFLTTFFYFFIPSFFKYYISLGNIPLLYNKLTIYILKYSYPSIYLSLDKSLLDGYLFYKSCFKGYHISSLISLYLFFILCYLSLFFFL